MFSLFRKVYSSGGSSAGDDKASNKSWEVHGWDDLGKMENLTKDCTPLREKAGGGEVSIRQ